MKYAKGRTIAPDKSQCPILEQFREYLDALKDQPPPKPRWWTRIWRRLRGRF